MHPILESILIVLLIGVIVFAAGATVGLIWFAIQRDHEADAARLDIPQDREFTDPQEADYLNTDYRPCAPPSINGRARLLTSRDCSFPHDTDYQSTPTKRF
jgi:hypothetical protein